MCSSTDTWFFYTINSLCRLKAVGKKNNQWIHITVTTNGYTYVLEANFAATFSLDIQKYQHFKFETVVL